MPKDKTRLLLVVIFAVAAGLIISSKVNDITKNTNNENINTISPDTPANGKKEPTNAFDTPAEEEVSSTSNDDNPVNYLEKIPECLNISVESNDSLKRISDNNRWMNKDPKNLIRQNLIFKNKTKEFRISIMPSESNKTWILQSFDVDEEGFPISKNKILGLQYYQLAEKIKSESQGFNLISDEQKILVDLPNTSGDILFINNEPINIKLFNKGNQRLLECQSTYCVCNQALSS